MYIKGNRNTLLWYIVFSIQWTLSIACFILLLQITYYTIPEQEKGEIFITGKERPLMDILQEQTEGTDKLSFGNWSGTIEGCLCNNGTIAKKTCRKANDTKCKEIIPPVSNITVYTWRGKSFYTTPSKYTYDDLFEISVDEKEECPFRYKKCGKLDYYNNTLCLPEDEKCPVNYLEITNSAEPPNKKFNFISIPFGDGYYIHYTNEDVDNYTIKNYFRSGDKIPCINFGDYNDTLPKYNLSAGQHKFGVSSNWGYTALDYVVVEEVVSDDVTEETTAEEETEDPIDIPTNGGMFVQNGKLYDGNGNEIHFLNVTEYGKIIYPSVLKHSARVIHGYSTNPKNKKKKGKAIYKYYNNHSLRHTFASRLNSLGVPDYVISALLGHKKQASQNASRTTQKYIHLSNEDLLKYAPIIEKVYTFKK